MTHRIALYQDYVHNNGSLILALQDAGASIVQVDAAAIIGGTLASVDTFIMPGGADLYYCEKLNGAGNKAIRIFVEAGGSYLGICAGAYYGCTALDWNDHQIDGARELGFVNATASGPIRAYMQDGDIEKSWYGAAVLEWQGQNFKTLYAAGPLFKNITGDIDVIARYAGGEPAVIGKRVGTGYVVLSSPHIEVTGAHFTSGRYSHNAKFEVYERQIATELTPYNAIQQEFFAFVLKMLKEVKL